MRYTNILSVITLATLLGLIAGACARKTDNHTYDREIYTPRYATGFAIKSNADSVTGILISNPWQGADNVTMTYRAEQPAQRIVAMSSTFVAMLESLGAADRIVGVSGLGFINSPALNARRGEIADVGYDTNIDFEKIVMLNPDLVLLYGVSGPNPAEEKLRELNIPYIYLGDYVEQSPLGKAEWVVAVGEIVGRREQAVELFNSIADNYNALRQSVADSESKPRVMVNAPYNDVWWVPSADNYMAQLIADAGGDYVCGDISGSASQSIDLEEAYMLMSEADIWLNPGQAVTLRQLAAMTPRFTDTRPFTAGNVYNNNLKLSPGGGNDFYESGAMHPDLVLKDLIKLFHPEALGDYDPTFYRRLQ
ncbi:MAG: ABC transporter substrate-binding protein [Bacteroidales bacterium]|nr:ABC transporter substrate-binding protein [Bacteroidales bacterium]